MPEMEFTASLEAADPRLSHTTAVVTDGRYSGAAKGPAVGHVTPEALDGGPIALVENGDLIEIHIPERRLDLVGVQGRRLEVHQMSDVLATREASWVATPPRQPRELV